MRGRTGPAIAGRRGLAALAATVAVLLVSLAAPPVARGHEFSLALVPATKGEGDAAGAAVVDGFRLAVDQSPDVSHPPGVEAGDHLGGVDVDVQLIEAGTAPGGVGPRVRSVVDAGASVVVVLGPSAETAEAVTSLLAGAPVLVVDAGSGPLATPPGSLGVLRLRDRATGVEGSSEVQFASAFERRYGRPPTDWAARGYDAARLLDVSLGQLGADSRDPRAMAEVANASANLVRSTVVAVGPGPSTAASGSRSPAARTRFPVGLGILGGAAALGAVALAVVALRRRETGG